MSLYKHMHKLSAARDDESRPLAERVVAAEVLETTARIVYVTAQAKAKMLEEMQAKAKQSAPKGVDEFNALLKGLADALRRGGASEAKQ